MSKMGVSRKDAASVAQRQTGGTTSHKRQGRRVGVSKSPSPGSNELRNCRPPREAGRSDWPAVHGALTRTRQLPRGGLTIQVPNPSVQ
jgi:hypothetical protein